MRKVSTILPNGNIVNALFGVASLFTLHVMSMWIRFVLVLALLILAELQSFYCIKYFADSFVGSIRNSILAIYIFLSAFCWGAILLSRFFHSYIKIGFGKNFIIAFIIGLFIGKILIFVVMLIDDSRRIVLHFVSLFGGKTAVGSSKLANVSRSKFLIQSGIILAGLSIGAFIYGVQNRYRYWVNRIKLRVDNLPDNFRGLKIVQISDVHMGSFDDPSAVEKGIERILNLNPDIVFFTGDLVNNTADEVSEIYKKIFAKIKAPMGVYSVLGNHDYGDYVSWDSEEEKKRNLEKLKGIHAELGWKLLINEHVVLSKDGQKLAIVGVENWGAKAHFPKYGDLKKAFGGLGEDASCFKILLSHDPSHWDEQVVSGYKDISLTFSGHTHGMQFGVDNKIFKFSPVQFIYNRWAGLYSVGSQFLYVNRGFGFLAYPGRVGIMPEITFLELV